MATISKYSTKAGPRYRVRYRKPDGSQTDRRGFTRKRDAEAFAASVEVSKLRGDYVDPTAGLITVAVIGDRRLAARKATLKPSSYNTERKEWEGRVRPMWGHRSLASIESSEVEEWIADMDGLSPTVVQRAFGILAGIYKTAMRDHLIGIPPTAGVATPKRVQKERAYLSAVQVRALADQCRTAEKRLLVLLLCYTGLRWGEATGLRVGDLDMLRRRVEVSRTVAKISGEWVVSSPKSGTGRSVAFPKQLVVLLARQCEGRGRGDYLFGDGGVEPLSRPSHEGWLHGAVARCQEADRSFPWVTPHDLRHTAASLAIQAGASAKAVQRMLGHASAAMTLDVYSGLFESDVDEVAAAMGRTLGSVKVSGGGGW